LHWKRSPQSFGSAAHQIDNEKPGLGLASQSRVFLCARRRHSLSLSLKAFCYNFSMSRTLPAKLDILDDEMAKVFQQKTAAERLAIAHGMWRHARTMILSILRREHPEWDDADIQREAARRLSHGAA
jgi:hypothetical protein